MQVVSLRPCHVLFVVITVMMHSVSAQLVNNSNGQAFTDLPFFNTSYINKLKVKEISGTYTLKKAGEKLQKTPYFQFFTFDRYGNLSGQAHVFKFMESTDTFFCAYRYDIENRLVAQCFKQGQGYMEKAFTYDSLSRRVAIENRLLIDTVQQPFELNVHQSVQMNKEQMVFLQGDNWRITRYFNEAGLAFMEQEERFNSLGYLEKKIDNYLTSGEAVTHLYAYDHKGRLAEIKTTWLSNAERELVLRFSYDEWGNLISKSTWKNGTLIEEIQALYSTKTGVFSSVIYHNVPDQVMKIWRVEKVLYYQK